MLIVSQVVAIVAPLFFIVSVGYFYGAKVRPEMRITNQLIMDVFMPALILSVMVRQDFHPSEYFLLMFAGSLVVMVSGAVAAGVAKFANFNWRSFVPPAMFSNWANLGIPLYVLSLGDSALGAGVMLVVMGNILCFTVGTYIYSGQLSSLDVLKTPIIIAVLIGGSINAVGIELASPVMKALEMLGDVAIPIMLFSLGVRLTRVTWSDSSTGVVMAILCPLAGIPLAMLICTIVPLSDLHQKVLILFGALPPAVVNFILAEQYQTDPEKVASMVLIGNIFAIVSLPLVLLLIL